MESGISYIQSRPSSFSAYWALQNKLNKRLKALIFFFSSSWGNNSALGGFLISYPATYLFKTASLSQHFLNLFSALIWCKKKKKEQVLLSVLLQQRLNQLSLKSNVWQCSVWWGLVQRARLFRRLTSCQELKCLNLMKTLEKAALRI